MMRKLHFYPSLLLLLLLVSCAETQDSRFQSAIFENAQFIDSKDYQVFLPQSYGEDPARKYPVLYMMDLQNLFVDSLAYGGVAWNVHEVIDSLVGTKMMEEVIVVGLAHASENRFSEYMPQKPIESLEQEKLKAAYPHVKPVYSDSFLKFLVQELKPHIDKTYSTQTEVEHTFIAGSSMGGLISMYAMCEYPEVFGGALCLSTHWIVSHDNSTPSISNLLMNYFAENVPLNKKWYFDYGTKGLDQHYGSWQTKIDSILSSKGYIQGHNWISRKFEGHDHNEGSWNSRVHIPLRFAFSERPNIIFIMSDDHAYQAISAYDTTLIRTPNIDRLANEGMRFDRAFVTNSICSPSRAVILTGKFSHLNSIKDNIDVFDTTQLTYPRILQANGYQTAVIGKWHLKSRPQGFDYWKVLPGQGYYYHPEFRTKEGIVKEEGYVTDIITDLAINFLKEKRDPSRPFMMMYQHKAPHREWRPSMENLDAFHAEAIPEPSTLFDDYAKMGTAAKDAEMRIIDHMGYSNDNKVHPDSIKKLGLKNFSDWYDSTYLLQYERLSEEEKAKWDAVYGPIVNDFMKNTPEGDALLRWKYQRYMQDYLATIKSVDENVGRLLDYLDEKGLAENTLVIYTSDQGFYLGEHGWFDKRFMYEESFRTPLLARWPGHIAPGQVNTQLVQNLDFAQTMLDAANAPASEEMQGESLLPIFKGTAQSWREALYYHYYEYPGIHGVKRHYGVRTDRYKLIHFYHDIDEWELYDLQTDPKESTNVYNQPAYKAVQEELHLRLAALREQYKDTDEVTQQMLEADLARLKR
jgi:arylsulfatase A-like enzyme/predicted alpha/beta superfamily hydrolase